MRGIGGLVSVVDDASFVRFPFERCSECALYPASTEIKSSSTERILHSVRLRRSMVDDRRIFGNGYSGTLAFAPAHQGTSFGDISPSSAIVSVITLLEVTFLPRKDGLVIGRFIEKKLIAPSSL
ncbi:unnamed protein product [Lasius platythorax]|uniref:Uncharacterized protein n=1 Tax=Lasius platythorax TaxID=488582 RepID=A0AAV2NQG2_9HYME